MTPSVVSGSSSTTGVSSVISVAAADGRLPKRRVSARCSGASRKASVSAQAIGPAIGASIRNSA
jgi:hypothetical protein